MKKGTGWISVTYYQTVPGERRRFFWTSRLNADSMAGELVLGRYLSGGGSIVAVGAEGRTLAIQIAREKK